MPSKKYTSIISSIKKPIKFGQLVILTSIFSILSLIFFGCKKDEATNRTSDDAKQIPPHGEVELLTDLVIVNDNNPYEAVGVTHNNLLDSIVSEIDTTDYVNSIIDAIASKSQSMPAFAGMSAEHIDSMLTAFESNHQLDTLSSIEEFAYGISFACPEGEEYFDQILTLLEGYDNPEELEELQLAVIDIENEILEDESIDPADAESLLNMTAIARYSSAYWTEHAALGMSSPWISLVVGTQEPPPLWWGILIAIGWDAVGGMFGNSLDFENSEERYGNTIACGVGASGGCVVMLIAILL